MSHPSEERGTIVDVELDATRLAGLAVVLLLLVGGAFWLGRWSGSEGDAMPAVFSREARDIDPSETVEVAGEGLFDRVGDDGAAAAPDRQVTREAAQGAFELDLGSTASRDEADRAKARLVAAGHAAFVAAGPGGGYRVAVGPYGTEDEAAAAARDIGTRFGVEAKIRSTTP